MPADVRQRIPLHRLALGPRQLARRGDAGARPPAQAVDRSREDSAPPLAPARGAGQRRSARRPIGAARLSFRLRNWRRRRTGTSCPTAPAGLAAGWVGDARGGLSLATAVPLMKPPMSPRARIDTSELTFERAETGAKLSCVCRNAPSPGDVLNTSDTCSSADSQHQFDPDSDLLRRVVSGVGFHPPTTELRSIALMEIAPIQSYHHVIGAARNAPTMPTTCPNRQASRRRSPTNSMNLLSCAAVRSFRSRTASANAGEDQHHGPKVGNWPNATAVVRITAAIEPMVGM